MTGFGELICDNCGFIQRFSCWTEPIPYFGREHIKSQTSRKCPCCGVDMCQIALDRLNSKAFLCSERLKLMRMLY
jgi:hypothetical protein